jgi:hypothetical protein
MGIITMSTFKPGDRVTVLWGLEDVHGTVMSLFGPPGKEFARVEVELLGDDEALSIEAVTLPVDLLERPNAA